MKYLKVERYLTSLYGSEVQMRVVDKIEDDGAEYFELKEARRKK